MKRQLDTLIANSILAIPKLPGGISFSRRETASGFLFWIKPADLKLWGKVMASIRVNIVASPFQILSEDTGECSAVFTQKHDRREATESERACGSVGPEPQLCNANESARVSDARHEVNPCRSESLACDMPGAVRQTTEKTPESREEKREVRQLTLF